MFNRKTMLLALGLSTALGAFGMSAGSASAHGYGHGWGYGGGYHRHHRPHFRGYYRPRCFYTYYGRLVCR